MIDDPEQYGKVLMEGPDSGPWQMYNMMQGKEPQQPAPERSLWERMLSPLGNVETAQAGGSDIIKKIVGLGSSALKSSAPSRHSKVLELIEQEHPGLLRRIQQGDKEAFDSYVKTIYPAMDRRLSPVTQPTITDMPAGRPRERDFGFYSNPDYLAEWRGAGSSLERNDIRRKWRKREFTTPQEVEELRGIRGNLKETEGFQYHGHPDYQKELSAATTQQEKNVVRNRWQMRELRSKNKD